MLIAFMIHAKLQGRRILHNKRLTFCGCTKKEQSVETGEGKLSDERLVPAYECLNARFV